MIGGGLLWSLYLRKLSAPSRLACRLVANGTIASRLVADRVLRRSFDGGCDFGGGEAGGKASNKSIPSFLTDWTRGRRSSAQVARNR